MKSKRAWSAAVVVVVGLTATLAGYKLWRAQGAQAAAAATPEPVETVQIVRATLRDFAPRTRSIGTVAATEMVVVRNEMAGTIREVGIRSGEVARKGQLLVRFDTREEEARLQAQLARESLAAKNIARTRSLMARGFTTQANIDTLTSEAAAARAEAEALRMIIAKKVIRAPFTARAGIHDLQPGQYLDEGATITTLQGVAGARYVDFTLPQDAAASVEAGATVQVEGAGLPAGGVTARVIAREPAASASRQVKYRVSIPSAETLLPGSFVDVTATVARAVPMVFVPRTAIKDEPQASYLFVVAADKAKPRLLRVKQRAVRLGEVVGEEVAVTEGLTQGEQVAANGSFKLRDGVLVQAGSPAGTP